MQMKVYIGNEGVKHMFNKFEEQKNEIIKWKVWLEWSRFECFKDGPFFLINNIS